MKLVNIHILTLVILFYLLHVDAPQAQNWSLEQCIDTALVYNKNLQMSKNNTSIAQEKQKEAQANLLPKITANADYKYFTHLPYQLLPLNALNPTAAPGVFREAQFGVPHNMNANLQLTLPLYNPQIYGAIKASHIATELNKLQFQKTEEQLYYDVAILYYNAQILHHQLAFLDSNIHNTEKLLLNAHLLNQQLLIRAVDLNKIKLQLAQLITQKENLNSKYSQVLQQLTLLIGISIENVIEIDPEIKQVKNAEFTQKPVLEIRILSLQNKILANDLSTLKNTRYIPSIHFFATYGTTGFGYNGQPADFLNFYPVSFTGLQLSYPLFNGTATHRKMNQKKLEIKNNQLQSELVSEQQQLQIEYTSRQKVLSQKTVATTSDQIELAKLIYHQTIVQQVQGTASLTDVLLADNALREAQQNYLIAITDLLKAELDAMNITGNMTNKNPRK